MLHRFGKTTNRPVADRVLVGCVWQPLSTADTAMLLRLTEVQSHSRIIGAVLYRAGRFKEAATKLKEVTRVSSTRAWDRIFLAMALYRSGQADEASEELRQAVHWISLADRPIASQDQPRWLGWFERVEVRALLDEARQLLNAGRSQVAP
jgi:hypothetical protein